MSDGSCTRLNGWWSIQSAYDIDLADPIQELLGAARGVDEKQMFGVWRF